MRNTKTLKNLFLFLTVLMVGGLIFGVATDTTDGLTFLDRILAALIGTVIILLLNYCIYWLLSKIWK